jgi:hypothetical protein
VKTKYQIYFLDPELGGWPTLQGGWGSELAGFGDLSEAEHVVAELERVYPGTELQIRELPETFWSAKLNKWLTVSD